MYDTIFSNWSSRQNIVDHYQAVLNELGYLNNTANMLFKMPERIKDLYPFTPRIILFGHTPRAGFPVSFGRRGNPLRQHTGTWVDQKPDMTWAEIEIVDVNSGRRDYEVSLWFYGEQTPRYSGTISIQLEEAEEMPRHR